MAVLVVALRRGWSRLYCARYAFGVRCMEGGESGGADEGGWNYRIPTGRATRRSW